jgi:hypothetical protein
VGVGTLTWGLLIEGRPSGIGVRMPLGLPKRVSSRRTRALQAPVRTSVP